MKDGESYRLSRKLQLDESYYLSKNEGAETCSENEEEATTKAIFGKTGAGKS